MAKRLTDSRKWDDDWFAELPPKYKLLWIYILDKCNHAGFFKPNMKMATFCIGEKITAEEALEAFNGRVEVIDRKWFIPRFIEFQYGNLNAKVQCHKSVINTLKNYNSCQTVKQLLDKGCLTLMDMDKDMDKDKNKDICKNLIKRFCDKHIEQTGIKYPIVYGKDNKLIYDLLETFEASLIETLMDTFFEQAKSPKTWWSDKISIGVFKSVIPNIIGGIRKNV